MASVQSLEFTTLVNDFFRDLYAVLYETLSVEEVELRIVDLMSALEHAAKPLTDEELVDAMDLYYDIAYQSIYTKELVLKHHRGIQNRFANVYGVQLKFPEFFYKATLLDDSRPKYYLPGGDTAAKY